MKHQKQTIKVWIKQRLKSDERITVEAYLVGGTDGVFAVWMDKDIVHMAAGDDGGWWEIASYHKDWMKGIIGCLKCLA